MDASSHLLNQLLMRLVHNVAVHRTTDVVQQQQVSIRSTTREE